ncbi:hypothetical protein NLG97_g5711 [Lecanicillium saksenae]|uniref:Uncharacterized protein n=1 Tax=Lecanicillium saksenae TaxID=468837 RepID=A0ACC1QUW2_9HYPO|nr:hypothetical protein NLG97_g5711 [Lecanicillium saksenae]
MATRWSRLFGAIVAAILLSNLYPYLSNRFRTFSIILGNTPSKLDEVNLLPNHRVIFEDKLQNCEDVLTIPSQGAAIIGCDRGRDMWNTVMGTFTKNTSSVPAGNLFLYRYKDSSNPSLSQIRLTGYASAAQFHPLGIAFNEASSTLLVSNHHFDGPRIEIFRLDISSHPPVARHLRTIVHPLIRSPNSIVALKEHEFFFTNDHYFLIRRNRYLAKLETYAALPLGGIVHVTLNSDWSVTARTVANLAYPNGIALLNASTIAVALTGSCQVKLFDIKTDRSLVSVAEIDVPFFPDNLSSEEDGVLLISGHPHPPSLERLVKHRIQCMELNLPANCGTLTAPSGVSEWTEKDGLRRLYLSETGFSASTTAVWDAERRTGVITGLYGDGILVWGETKGA